MARQKINPGSKRARNKGVKTKIKTGTPKTQAEYQKKKDGSPADKPKIRNFAGKVIGHKGPGIEGTAHKFSITLLPGVLESIYGTEEKKEKKAKAKKSKKTAATTAA